MNKLLCILLVLFGATSCLKNKEINLSDTRWHTQYKYEGFSFFAEKELVLNKDNTCYEFGNIDTVYGNWVFEDKRLKVDFENKTIIRAIVVHRDSLSGYRLSATKVSGEWNAKRK
ncbi:MAG TPA: hypothetical protein PKA15_08280 [Chitinophagales bacterium]|nr:hypothetical protein [Chitinophagales bacterium]HMW94477.1 hypothetical protein [Chitinophagales bacterium]